MKQLFKLYQNTIINNCMGNVASDSVQYWQNHLFASTMQVVIPLSLITLIPGITYSLLVNMPLIAVFDVASFFLVLYIAFGSGLSLNVRKLLLILCTYFAAIYLLIYIGFKGPGFLFLYSACIFGILILPVKYAYWWSWGNVTICGFFTLVVHYKLSPVPEVNDMSAAEWVAISVNLLFLSFLTSALLPKLLSGLSESLDRQKKLQNELSENHKALETSLKQLEKKNEDLEQFAYVVSHDLQEPLRMVSSFLTLLKKKYENALDDKAQQYIHFAVDGAIRMQKVIRDLLEYSKVGQHKDQLEMISLEEMAMEVVQQQETIKATKTKIQYLNLPKITTYRTPLLQVLQNLISNALKYRNKKHKPEIIIAATDIGHEWEISIKDNGIGIEKTYFNKIFDLFQRLHDKGTYSGTGIGLAIVKKNIESLGGRVWVESVVGQGSTFYFTLPK